MPRGVKKKKGFALKEKLLCFKNYSDGKGVFLHFPSSPSLQEMEAGILKIPPSHLKPGGGWEGIAARSPSPIPPQHGGGSAVNFGRD